MAFEMVKSFWKETKKFILWILSIFALFFAFVVQGFYIPTNSMLPTIQLDDRVYVAKYFFTTPSRGTICVFQYPEDESRDFIQRIIAIPGDTVDIKDGIVYINGSPTDEPYVVNKGNFPLRPNGFFVKLPFTVPKNHYFTLGDNRMNSMDGRYWGFLPEQNIRGPAFFRYWPLTRMGLLR